MKIYFQITLLCALVFVSCTPQRTIYYDMKKYQPVGVSTRESISIESFIDIRSELPENDIYFSTKNHEIVLGGNRVCITAEAQYKPPIMQQLAKTFAKHLAKKYFFDTVQTDTKETSDYYLTAKVRQFGGQQQYSHSAAVGAQFGLIGALATSNVKTQGSLFIEIADITLFDKDGNEIAIIGDLKKEIEGEMRADAYCNCVYNNLYNALADVFDDLAEMVVQEIKDVWSNIENKKSPDL